ncbi:MAG: tRNA (adenosine(37)-N6)-dimethylallyltransferase MiaA [Saezia sp.]
MKTEYSYICVAGPTASGKTSVALEIGKRWPVEIISVDSALVYRGLNIGSAKPSKEEMMAVRHHLIDIREPDEPYSAADFVKDATHLIGEIHQRGHIPLLVGGTMLYFKALIEGLDDLPAATPEVRKVLEEEAAQQGWPAMHEQLRLVDPASAERLKPNDSQRIQRALEVYRVSGHPLSSFFTDKSDRKFPPMLSLEPENRAWLHERIALRFEQMLTHGFLDEVRGLMKRPELHAELPSIRAVGYRQAWTALENAALTGASDDTIKVELMQTGVAATRQLAKRQITWLRSMSERHVVYGDDPQALEKALAWVKQFIDL